MCPNLKCAYAEKGEMLYMNDPDHLSNYSSRYIIAPAIIKFIEEKLMYYCQNNLFINDKVGLGTKLL